MTFEKVVDIIARELKVSKEKITLESNLQTDLGADSLDAVELIMAMEDEFGVTVPDEVAQTFRTVKDLVVYIENNK